MKLIKKNKYYYLIIESGKEKEHHTKIKTKQKYWNNKRWRYNDLNFKKWEHVKKIDMITYRLFNK